MPNRSPKILSSPFGRKGSKHRLAAWIVFEFSLIPHTKFGELFAGTIAVFLFKAALTWEFLNDADQWIANFLSVCRDREQRSELLRRLRYTGWDITDFNTCISTLNGSLPPPGDPVERARMFLVANQQSFDKSGRTHSISDSSSGIPKWKRIHEHIEAMAVRIKHAQIFCRDYAEVLQLGAVNDPRTAIYADPPYVGVEKLYYNHNQKDGFDHRALRDSLERFAGSVVVSYEDNPEIRQLYLPADGWRVEERKVTRALANNAKPATELLLIRLSDWARANGSSRPRRKVMQDIFAEDGSSLT